MKNLTTLQRSGTTYGLGRAPVLIWENENPTANFAAQTISQDTGGFSYYLVKMSYTTSDDTNGIFIVALNERASMSLVGIGSTHYAYTRRVTISEDAIQFEAGYRNGSSNAQYAIPLAVYGIW